MVTKYDFFDGGCHAQKGHGDYVKDEDYEALKADRDAQQKLAEALAVENAAMKAAFNKPDAWLSWHSIPPSYQETDRGGEYLAVHDRAGDKSDDGSDSWAVYRKPDIETPATSAAIAAIEARGIDQLIERKLKQLANMHPDTHAFGATAMSLRAQINELQAFATDLREAK